MIQKKTWLFITDNTNVIWLRIFHLYKGFFRKKSTTGFFVKGSVRIVEPPRIEYKGFKVKFNKKGDICRSLLVRTRYVFLRADSSLIRFKNNSGILIKKKQELKSKYLYGPISKNVRKKKFLLLFDKIL